MPSQLLMSSLGIVLSAEIAMYDVKRGAMLWACFWFVMLVLHIGLIVEEFNKENV